MEHNKYGIGSVFSIDDKNKMNKDDYKIKTNQNNSLVLEKESKKNLIQNSNKDSNKTSKQTNKDKNVVFGNKIYGARSIVAIILVFIISVFAVGSVVIANSMNSSTVISANTTNTRIVQAKLSNLGYYNGAIDGVFDDATINAIKDYQQDKNLAVTGNLDIATTTALGVTDNSQANTDLYLLAKLIYSEARGEIYEGQVAVGAVVLNRVGDAGFPNTLQGVIYQPWAFTALHDGQFQLEPNGTAYQAAQDAMNGWDPTYGCLFYYNPKTATSSWIFTRQIVVTIGNHVFCY